MGHPHVVSYFILLHSILSGVHSQTRTLIDVDTDIPDTDAWKIQDCGYADLSADYYCDAVGSEGGISIPPDDLAGEKGFWSTCAYRCVVKYIVQPGDVSFKARIYQRNLQTEVSYDGIRWDYLDGTGWIEFPQVLEGTDKKEISLKFDRLGDEWFTVLDKIVVNGEFDPPSDPTTEQTSITDGETSSTSESERTTEITETTTEDFSSTTTSDEISTTTTDDDGIISSTTEPTDSTTFSSSTTDDAGVSSSPVSDGPTDSSTSDAPTSTDATTETETLPSESDSTSLSSTTEIASTSTDINSTPITTDIDDVSTTDTSASTDTDSTDSKDSTTFSSTTDYGSTETPQPTSTTDTSTDDTTTDSGSGKPPTSPVSPPGTTSVIPPDTTSTASPPPATTKKSSGSGFLNGVWGALLFSILGIGIFLIIFIICCLRCIYGRGFPLRRRGKRDDTENIISETDSNSTKRDHSITDRELYTYMNRYPYLMEPDLSRKPPPPPPSKSSSLTSAFTPRAIYRESTPYKAFEESTKQINVGTQSPSLSSSIDVMYAQNDHVKTARSIQVLPRYPVHRVTSPVIPSSQYPEPGRIGHNQENQNKHHEQNSRLKWAVP